MDDRLRGKATVSADGIVVQTWTGTLRPAIVDLEMTQGATFSLRVTWIDDTEAAIDLSSGYTAAFKVKNRPGASTTHISLTNGSGITLDSAEPTIIISRTAAQTAAYTGWVRASYDLEITLTSSSTVYTILAGTITLRPEVTA